MPRDEGPAAPPQDRGAVPDRSASVARAWANRPRRIAGAGAKTADWLTMREAAASLGTTREVASFRRAWDAMVASAAAGGHPAIDGTPVRMMPATVKGVDRWCLHRDDLALLAPASGRRERVWPSRPEGWLTLDEATVRAGPDVDPDVMADAWRALTKGTQYVGISRLAALDIRLRRGHLHANERWFMHPDDAARLADAVRGRLPHLRRGYLTTDQVAGHVDDDSRGTARRLLGKLAEARAAGGRAEIDGQTVEIRRFLVDGRAFPCLAVESLPPFLAWVEALDAPLGESDVAPRM